MSISLTDKNLLRNLFNKTKFKNVKEQSGLNEPILFNNFVFTRPLISSGH